VPALLEVSAAWCWRLVVVSASVYLLLVLLARLGLLVLALVAAVLLTALLSPIASAGSRGRLSRAMSSLLCVVVLLAALSLVVAYVSRRAAAEFGALQSNVTGGLDEVRTWLVHGPLSLDPDQVSALHSALLDAVTGNGLAGHHVWSAASTTLHVLAGAVLAVFTLFFSLKDGAGVAAVLVALVAKGLVAAALVVVAVIAVQQIEGNLLQPLIVGRALQLHPLAILTAVTAGTLLAGIAGAVVAVPLLAVVTAVARYFRELAPDART
jgi:predicted PurR-regulated permease PerM